MMWLVGCLVLVVWLRVYRERCQWEAWYAEGYITTMNELLRGGSVYDIECDLMYAQFDDMAYREGCWAALKEWEEYE